MRSDFEHKLALGRQAEKAVAAWLMGRGMRILPVYDYSGLDEGKAPKLTAAEEADSLVLPDLLSAKAGRSIWVEVKFKEHADFTYKTGRLETGISKRLWEHYQRVQAETGFPVWLVFAHLREDELRGAPISKLREKSRIYEGTKMGKNGMVFFDYRALRILAKLSEIAPALIEELTCKPIST
jgi:hypothetical protein